MSPSADEEENREMTVLRPARDRRLVAMLLSTCLALVASGCAFKDRILGPEVEDPEGVAAAQLTGYGPCWPTLRNGVLSASTNRAGLALMVAEGKPSSWTADNWSNSWRSLEVVDLDTDRVRYIAHTWSTGERFQVAATAAPPNPAALGPEIVEQPAAVAIAADSDRFVLATVQEGHESGYRYLYHGQVPPSDNHVLDPTNGLSRLPMNDPNRLERVRAFEISPDGNRVAAIVGQTGELRIFDVPSSAITVYDLEDDGIRVSHTLPDADVVRRPAYATTGVVRMAWSPDGTTLALARAEQGARASLGLLDVETGDLTHVRTFHNSTAPNAVWSPDGTSLTIMYTPLGSGGSFGHTQFARLMAAENAPDTAFGEIERPQGYKTEPAFLTMVDDSRYLFQWEGGVWQVTVPGGDFSAATAVRVTTSRQITLYEPVGVVPALDIATFRVTNESRSTQQFGLRLSLSAPTCDIEGDAADS